MTLELPEGITMTQIIIGSLLIITLIIIIIVVVKTTNKVATPSTVKGVVESRVAILNNRIEHLQGSQKSIGEKPLPDNQKLLINYSVKGCRLSGYLGPLQDGTFSEDDSVRLALMAGCRLFILEISSLDSSPTVPYLVARDSAGFKRALNDGSIEKVAKALAEKAFSNGNQEPLMVVLYFHDAPNKNTHPSDYLSYLSGVAKAIEPLVPYHIGLTGIGDFTRQKMESSLFSNNPSFYMNKVIIMTNADTSFFRNPSLLGITRTFTPKEDLDFLVHARIYKQEGGSDLGITEVVGSNSTTARVIMVDDSYLLLTPPDRIQQVTNLTRNTFTIVMKKDPMYIPSLANSTKLFHTYGVHSIPIDIFNDDVVAVAGVTKDFEKNYFLEKDVALRFTKPSPIIPSEPNKELDAKGGHIVAPGGELVPPLDPLLIDIDRY